jgi:histidinol-phosphate/aromatic aminotransferase/cobyric acid decarboxylase-like protein
MKRHPKEVNTHSIRLDKNECICPSFIRELLIKAEITENDYFNYSSTLEVETGLELNLNCRHIYTDNGSEQVLKGLINVLDVKTWVIATPAFEMFSVYCSLFKKHTKSISFSYNNNTFSIDLFNNNFVNHGLYIASPHNPTGYTLSENEISKLSKKYLYIIIDQAYFSPLECINSKNIPKNVIIVRSFSKMGGLTGMRFGFCITSNIDIINNLNLLRPMYLNSVTIKLVNTILNNPNLLLKIPQEFKSVKDMLNLQIVSEAGNFILVDGVSEYKQNKFKKYTFNDQVLYRMTLFDIETYYKL